MFGIQHYASFVSAVLVFQAVPGPGVLAILRATGKDGINAGLGATLGSLCGDLLYMLAAILGLAAVLASYPAVFAIIRWLGIAYLIWIGITLLRTPAGADQDSDSQHRTAGAHFLRAFTITLANPKAIMFFMAFFPLFIGPGAPPMALGFMVLHVVLIGFLYGAGLVLIGNLVARRFSRCHAAQAVATRLAGLAIIGFGLKLSLDGQ